MNLALNFRALLPAAFLLVSAAVSRPAPAHIVEQIMIRVNNNVVTRADFEKRRASTLAAMNQKLSGDELLAGMKSLDTDVLKRMTEELLLIERAKQLYDLEKLIDFQQDNFMQSNKIAGKTELEAKLKSEGMTMAQFRDEILHYSVPDFVRSREIRSQLAISRAEVEAYYNAHPNEFTGSGRRRTLQIVVDAAKHEDGGAALRAAVTKALADGEDFPAVATTKSDAVNAAESGDLGFVKPHELRAELDQVIFALPKAGAISAPITLGEKTYWFQVVKIEGVGLLPLDDAREEVERILMNERYPAAAEKFLVDLWSRNYVVIAPEHRAAITPPGVK